MKREFLYVFFYTIRIYAGAGLRNLSRSRNGQHANLIKHYVVASCVVVRTNASHARIVGSIGCISRCSRARCGGGLTSICSTRIVARRNKSRVFPRFFLLFFATGGWLLCPSAAPIWFTDRLFPRMVILIYAIRRDGITELTEARRRARVIHTDSVLFSTRIITGDFCSRRWFELSLSDKERCPPLILMKLRGTKIFDAYIFIWNQTCVQNKSNSKKSLKFFSYKIGTKYDGMIL